MKHTYQLGQAALALGGLLFGLSTQATDVAELPLKTSVLAKPNVVFALDDSGSMDAEMMIDGVYQGFYWGNYNSNTLHPGGQLRTGTANWDWGLLYLFPNGTGAGNRVNPDATDTYGLAVPPTPQMAWLRSPTYNSLYYDTRRSYEPWAPAYLSGAGRSYNNASTTATPSHPALGSTTMALASNLNATQTDWRFTFTGGMTIPQGVTNLACFGNTPNNIPPGGFTVGTNNLMCKAAMSYYPATFWNLETCTANGSDCVAAWDGRTLKRYEIKAGNSFPSGRSYADELQNFANWFTYYRKRRLMLGAAMSEVLENISGLRLGVVRFNARAAPTMYDADDGNAANNRLAVSGIFQTTESAGGTPTHATMAYVYDQFNTNTNLIQYACQRNVSFVITDGFANDSATAAPAYEQGTYGASRPYQSIAASSLADKALAHYTLRLRAAGTSPLTAGRVPPGRGDVRNPDTNTNLHLQTYALTLGMKGTVWPTAIDPFTTPPIWPAPVSNSASMIDDLWHATINGRGQMYLATDAAGTAAGITAGLADILSQPGAQSGVAVSSINLERGDSRAYLATYNPAGWAGDLAAYTLSASTGEVGTDAAWRAASLLAARDWNTRAIASYVGSSGVAFTSANVGALVNPGLAWGSNDAVVNYLRGSRSGEGSSFRSRSSLLSAVINAEPVLSRSDRVIYLASGEGMLHAFDTDTGVEMWAFVPGAALPDLGRISNRNYSFRTRLDATPVLGKLAGNGKRILVGAMGGAGRSYYALDVSQPRSLDQAGLAAAALWQFPASTDTTNQGRMGYSYGQAVITKNPSGNDVVLVTSGYDNGLSIGDGKGRLWMLNANTGAVISEFVTTDGTAGGAEAGLAHVSAFRESDGTVRHVYGGDLLGNLWHFDLSAGTTTKVAMFKDSAGNAQPVTAAPELVSIAGQRLILIGTGRLLDITDFGSSRTQSFYAVTDGALLANARSALAPHTYSRGGTPEMSGTATNWENQRGWYFDLPAGEQANTAPTVAHGVVGFTTNVNGGSNCTQSSYMYLLDLDTGLKAANTDFASALVSAEDNASRLTLLRLSNGQLGRVIQKSNNGVSSGSIGQAVRIPAAKNAWREIRR